MKWLVGNSVDGSRLSQHELSNSISLANERSAAPKNSSRFRLR